ncbi:MAG: sigma-70 family RNA polymerase sigma factor [Gammaproteobacteria bacterium]
MGRLAHPFDPHILVLKAQQGDNQAFQELVEHYEPSVKKLINRYVSDQGEVSDLSQETFLKMYKAIGRFRGESQFYTWLYRVAVNTVKNYLTYQERHTPASDLSLNDNDGSNYWVQHLPMEPTTPESLLLGEEAEVLLLNALKTMSKELRLSLLLRDIEGLSYREIAQTMHCPIGTVRSRIFRARAAVMQVFSPIAA